jgi:hypothetical protein
MKMHGFEIGRLPGITLAAILSALILVLLFAGLCQAQEPVDRKWGIGWDQGLTLRAWLGGRWEIALAAGPDDYLSKEETRSWFVSDPSSRQGVPEVPEDIREEHGWVRFQLGRLIKRHGDFAVAGYGGVVYEWIVHQERNLVLQDLGNGYDSFELDRNTERWVMTLGLRPSWQPTSFLTIETAFGLNFIVDNWDQTTNRTWTGVDGSDHLELDGHGQKFQDFGFEGAASVQIFIWL